MKAAFSAEAIGLDAATEVTARRFGLYRWFYRQSKPWVAEITGLCPRYGYARTFLRHKADYKNANSKGTRGVWFWWTLESGRIYETRYRTSWKNVVHRFMTVTDEGDIKDLTEEEVRAWLASRGSASTS